MSRLVEWMTDAADDVRRGGPGKLFSGSVRPVVTYTAWETPRLAVSAEHLQLQGVDLVALPRAGGSYFMGDSQVLLYPVISLAEFDLDPVAYTWCLEETARLALHDLGVEAHRRPELNGLWTSDGRIARAGSSVHHGVTRFGLSVNLGSISEPATYTISCAADCGNGSVQDSTGEPPPSVELAASALADGFATVFSVELTVGSHAPA